MINWIISSVVLSWGTVFLLAGLYSAGGNMVLGSNLLFVVRTNTSPDIIELNEDAWNKRSDLPS